MTKETTFTLRKVAKGRSHFARVAVAIESGKGYVTERTRHREELADVDRKTAPEWVQGALDGAMAMLETLRLNVSQDVNITVTRVQGTEADTRFDTVWCAAAMAVWHALQSPGKEPHLSFVHGRWTLKMPNGGSLVPRIRPIITAEEVHRAFVAQVCRHHCPDCGEQLTERSSEEMHAYAEQVCQDAEGTVRFDGPFRFTCPECQGVFWYDMFQREVRRSPLW